MDGEVNNRTARITQDVKRDNRRRTHKMDAQDGRTRWTDADEHRQTQQMQTNTDRHNRCRRTQTDITDADEHRQT